MSYCVPTDVTYRQLTRYYMLHLKGSYLRGCSKCNGTTILKIERSLYQIVDVDL